MRKLIILLSISLMSFNINAFADSQDHIVQQQVWHDVELPANLKSKSLEQVNSGNASTTATAYAASGMAGQNISVSGFVSYYILNSTGVSQNYWVDEYMCIDGQHCTHVRNTVTLSPNLTAQGSGVIYTNSIISNKGTHQDEAIIQISGESTSYTQGVNNIYVN